MGIDIYLKWKGMKKKDKQAQITGFSALAGEVGYLREAYHGGPYPSKILVREAFESPTCEAEIPAALMRERLTSVTEPAVAGDDAHMAAMMIAQLLQKFGPEDATVEPAFVASGRTSPMTVEEAVRERCAAVYPDLTPDEVDARVHSYREFVALAERKEKETGQPCTVIASY